MTQVRVVFHKYDGSLHWNNEMVLLGEDEHGVWAGAPAGSVSFRGLQNMGPVQAPFVQLLPRTGWWAAAFNAEPHRTEIYCDISTVPVWVSPSEVTMVDLDLDVRRRRTGVVERLDEDEFADHQVKYGYPAEVIAAAQASFEWVYDAISQHAEPFGDASHSWLAKVR